MGLFGNNTANSRLLGYRVSTSISSKALPLVFGTTRLSGNVIWTGDWQAQKAGGKAGKGKGAGSYTYTTAGISALCQGPIAGMSAVWTNQVKNGQTTTSYLNAVTAASLNLTLFTGALGQAAWSYVTSHHPAEALGYSNIAYVADDLWDLGSSGMFPNYSYEIQGFDIYGGGQDAVCSQVIYRLLTDPIIGAGLATYEVDVTEASDYCLANSIFVSPVLDSQKAAAEWLKTLILIANAEAVWSEGVLKIRSRGDVAATGNGATFTPNITPVADLTDYDFMDRTEPVQINRPNPRDAYNSVTVNWTNRGNQYNTEPCQEQDQASIDTYGLRPASAVDALGICLADVAAKTAHVQLKQNLYNRTKYKFKLGMEHILLEPMDIVTLTCKRGTQYYQGLNLTPVRLLAISEDANGFLDCEAEEMPLGAGTPISHPKQAGGSFAPPTNASPGSVNVPVFYEACYQMRQALYSTQYALLIALSGGRYWGGCSVYRSWDGTTYELVGRQAGVTPMGILSANLASGADPDNTHTLSVNLLESFGTLSSVALADADNFKTLSVLGGGATSELVSYETATLTGVNTYDLTYLRRGVYGSPIASHATNDAYFRVDNAFSWIYQAQDIGKTVYFKFTSFNQYGNAEQSLGDVTAYPYTLTGGLTAVKTVTANYTIQPSDVAVNVDASGGPVTITFPTSSTAVNTTVVVTKVDSSGNTVTLAGAANGTNLTQQYQSETYQSSPAGWTVTATNLTPRFIDDETPTGSINGTNPTFTLAHPPSPATSLELYLNGDLELQGLDYTLSGATITMTTAPVAGDWLRAFYRW